ncbi:MAG: threonylcarbamoyl-AMP synthase [Hyphomicrobiales bacterium]|nr:threonylcarbamoyl-AMP synthase [Hyphomicrobiales bacterium]
MRLAVADIIKADDAVEQAIALLMAGAVVAIPTETVYGLAADATNGDAVLRIFEAKGRPRFNPLIAHASSIEMAEKLAAFDPLSRALAEKFWPGPLTMVLPLANGSPLHPLVTAGLDTVALRSPRGFGGELIAALGRPLAAPSANSSGRVSGTSAQAVADDLGDRIPLVVDGGPTPVGVESTIIKVEDAHVLLLRPGGLPAEDIEAVIDRPLVRKHGGQIIAPGMLASHYAPDAQVRLNATSVLPEEALLAFGPHRADGATRAAGMLNLSESGDLREASRNLFAYLQKLDRIGAKAIAVEPIPMMGLGEAINDRLARAAAPRGPAVSIS